MRRSALVYLALSACSAAPPAAPPASPPAEPPAAEPAPVGFVAPASPPPVSKWIAHVVADPERSEADRALDDGRHPAELLAWFDVQKGMKVGELFAGGGYTAELLARAVGPEGRVYGVNSPWVLEKFAAGPWAERLQKPIMATVTRLDRAFDDPFPPEVHDLDRVFAVLVYHDFVWMEADRDRLNAAVFRALKPGGVFAIVDHSAAAGRGVEDVKTLHRIEESVVTADLRRAGFTLAGTADFLRNPDDTRDWSASPGTAGEKRGTSDRFVQAWGKP